MTSYVDTILIDCNRKGSEEYKIKKGLNEPAVFTCKQGAGIKLNPGDEVSVHSAYINERGNEDNIEFSGKVPKDNQTYELEYTDIIQSRLTTTTENVGTETQIKIQTRNKEWDGPDHRIGYGRADCLYYQYEGKGVQQTTAINRKKVFDVVDNEINFAISYYKNMNGEGYLSLPRRFDAPNPMRPDYNDYGYPNGSSAQNNHSADTFGPPSTHTDTSISMWAGAPTYPRFTPSTAGKFNYYLEYDFWQYLYTAYDGNARITRMGDWAPEGDWNDGQKQTTWAANEDSVGADFLQDGTSRYKNRFLNNGDGAKARCLTTAGAVGPDCYFTGRCRPINTEKKLLKSDYVWYPDFQFSAVDSANNRYPQAKGGGGSNVAYKTKMVFGEMGPTYKHRQDNDRMTIYIKQTTFWTKGANNLSKARTGYPMTGAETTAAEVEAKDNVDDILGGGIDPALTCEWIRYKEIKNVKMDTGYNTPDDVAEQFTDQLNKTQVSEPVKAELMDNADEPQDISVKQTSECYKPFHSANHYTFGENTDTITRAYAGANNAITDQAMIDWQTAYHYIGIKRPDLWDAGRAIYYDQIQYPGFGTGRASARTFPKIASGHNIAKAAAQADGARIVSTIPWTEANVMKYKALFDAQVKYPELFDYDYNVIGGVKQEMNINNARFLHLDQDHRDGTSLGSDNYEDTATAATAQNAGNKTSTPIFFDFYPEHEHLEYSDDFPENAIACYGIFTKVPTNAGAMIGFNAYNIKLGDPVFAVNTTLSPVNCIGWDCHFSAYGTKCIMLYTGNLNALYSGKDLLMMKDNNKDPAKRRFHNTYPYIRDTYLGANQIEIGVEEKGKFYLHQLHTPEYIGNSFASGSSADNPISADASDQVYRVNKRLSGDNYCPDMVPYRPTISTDTDTANNGKVEISNFNNNLSAFTIYDSMSGIFIEDTGIDLDDWENGLWGKLGFSYQQFNSSITSDRQTRLNNLINVENIGAITTNADITAGDVPTYPRNAFGGEYYNNALPNINFPAFENNATEFGNLVIPSVPAITETQTSVRIAADGLPIKMNTPYLLVKSDIVQDTKYYGMGADNGHNYTTGQLLPIVGVVNKENGFGDYYFETTTQMAFTITKPSVVSSITTSIHNPDMSLARLENDSAVIYKIKKTNSGNYNIAAELIKKGQLNINPPQDI